MACYIGYPNIVKYLRVIKRNFSGDYEVRVTRMRVQNENGSKEKFELRCITPREMARLCIGAFMVATRGRVGRDVEKL